MWCGFGGCRVGPGRAPARSGAGTGAGMQWWLPGRSQGCSAVTFGARGDAICSEHAPLSVGLCKAGVVPLLLVHRWPCVGPHCVARSAESSWLQGICAVSVRVQASAWGICTVVAYPSLAAVPMIRPCRVTISSRGILALLMTKLRNQQAGGQPWHGPGALQCQWVAVYIFHLPAWAA